MKIRKIFNYIIHPSKIFIWLGCNEKLNWIPDKIYLKIIYKLKMDKKLDLNNPKTFNEKLQWLKLYDRKDIYTTMVDKYEVKKYVSNIIGDEYIVPTLGVWNSFDEIDFNKLPEQFVLKCTHDSGGLVICKDKKKFDIEKARKKIEKSLKRNFYYEWREWPYKNVKKKIIAEKYLDDGINKTINDYKVYTFGGKAKMMMINTDRGIDTKADYFDENFNWLDFKWGYEHSNIRPRKPDNFEKMLVLAEKLSKGTKELRVDFYDINDKIYFGELTFFDGAGFDAISPVEWDYKIGSMIKL